MKFRYTIEPYQSEAVKSVVDVFLGQPYLNNRSYLRDVEPKSNWLQLDGEEDDFYLGYANAKLKLDEPELLDNLHKVQDRNRVKRSAYLCFNAGALGLDVEMETGTGKTYVYLKTMFELNRCYGWSKFIVVVPSIAIREGVKQSLETTRAHFMEHYGKKIRFFTYDSKNLTSIDTYSQSADLNLMIINMQAFNSLKEGGNSNAARIINSERDEFGSRKPIDVIAANRPIVILDEPQKMEGKATQAGIRRFRPLFCLHYSATHKVQHNLVYVLDALDAYNQRLVKRIEVKGFEVRNLRGTDSYLYLDEVLLSATRPPRARVELEVSRKGGIRREFRILEVADDLFHLSNELEQYKNTVVSDINGETGEVSFTNGAVLCKGQIYCRNDEEEKDFRRAQIRETILSHLQKEEKLFSQGIKTLSLFFIDEVAKYRQYDEQGQPLLGEYAKIFEEEYRLVINDYRSLLSPKYTAYLDGIKVRDTHRGYFSIDKKTGRSIDSQAKTKEKLSDDISAYDLILRSKERLLSFAEPTRFIFSHSALREGWDNPNVFQICTLKHSDSNIQKRQEVGRGMRLCLNQLGERMDQNLLGEKVQEVNLLTVIASESYRQFADSLQQEIREEIYQRPAQVNEEYFIGKTVSCGTQLVTLDEKQARLIYRYLLKHDYIDSEDKVTQTYCDCALSSNLAQLPAELEPLSAGIHQLIRAIYDDSATTYQIDDANTPKLRENPLNDRFYKAEFQELWQTINHKYSYTVDFNSKELIEKAIRHLDQELRVSELRYTVTAAKQREKITEGMLELNTSFAPETSHSNKLSSSHPTQIPYDLVGKIASGTKLTRKSAASILKGISPSTFACFRKNPEEFIAKAIALILDQKSTLIVEHISYNTIEGSYDSSIFTTDRSTSTLHRAYRANKAIQDYIFTDGQSKNSVEQSFAHDLDQALEVMVYAKLPRGFHIPTPVGNYSPDWAIVFYEGVVKHVYFIAETKGSMSSLELRAIEKAKIDCAKRLFQNLSPHQITFAKVDSFEELLNQVLR